MSRLSSSYVGWAQVSVLFWIYLRPSTLAYVSPIYLQLILRRAYFYWERVCVQVIRYTKLEPLSFGSNGHFLA